MTLSQLENAIIAQEQKNESYRKRKAFVAKLVRAHTRALIRRL